MYLRDNSLSAIAQSKTLVSFLTPVLYPTCNPSGIPDNSTLKIYQTPITSPHLSVHHGRLLPLFSPLLYVAPTVYFQHNILTDPFKSLEKRGGKMQKNLVITLLKVQWVLPI